MASEKLTQVEEVRADQELMVGTHAVSDREMEIFGAMMRCGTLAKASRETGYSVASIKVVTEQPWFQRMYDQMGGLANKSFLKRVQDLDEVALRAYEEIVTGKRKADKSTMAQAKLIELRLRAGKDPILDTRSMTTTVHNDQKNMAVFLTMEQMRELSQVELIELNRSGRLPERFLKVSEARKWEPPKELGPDVISPEARAYRVKHPPMVIPPEDVPTEPEQKPEATDEG